jgi:starch synthase
MSGGWMFGYLESLRSAGDVPVLVCVSLSVRGPVRTVHRPTGIDVVVLPPTRAYRAARRLRLRERRGRVAENAAALVGYVATPPLRLAAALRRERIDTILCQEYETPRFDVCIALGRSTGRRVFATYQGGDRTRTRLEHLVRSRTVRRASGLVIAAGIEIDRVKASYAPHVPPIARIANPLDVPPPVSRSDARAELGIGEHEVVVAWHGRVEIRRKGLDVLLDAWDELRAGDTGHDLRLLLMGTGSDAERLHQRVDGRDDVTWIDRYVHERSTIATFLAAADVYAFASPHEGFAVAPLEAMAAGLPVVATRAPGIAELVGGDGPPPGVIVPVDDPHALATELRHLVDDPERRRAMGASARARVEGAYSIAAVGTALHAFLDCGGVGATPPHGSGTREWLAPAGPEGSGPVPTFSVIVAAYQRASTIAESVASALDQVPPPLEVVVCDDGSTDDIVGALAPFGDRVRLVRSDHGGEASAKNVAWRAARGDFVVILDADDIYLPGRLAALGALAAARPDLDILTTDALLERDGRRLPRSYYDRYAFEVDDQRAAILQRNFVFGLVAIRRSRLVEEGGFDERIRHAADWECWIRLVLGGSRVGLVRRPLAVYRLHEASMSADTVAMSRGVMATLRTTLDRDDLAPHERALVERRLEREAHRLEVDQLLRALERRDPGVRRLAMALARSPWPAGTRVRAAAAWLAPRPVGWLARHQRARRARADADVEAT